MATIWLYSLLSVTLVSLISLIGIFTLPVNEKKLRSFLIYFVSFAAGALFGDVFIHVLPETTAEHGFTLSVSLYVLAGIIMSFILEKIIHWRHAHHPFEGDIHPLAMMVLLGDSLHNFIDGLIIGASFLTNIHIGIATTIAIVLHEIPHEVGDFGVLLHSGFTKQRALFYNFITALTAILGTIVALLLANVSSDVSQFLLPFAAGNFVYIAGSDLIPELHTEEEMQKNVMQIVFFVLGVAFMMILLIA